MMTPSSNGHQTNLFGKDLLQQLDPQDIDPLLVLAAAIPEDGNVTKQNLQKICTKVFPQAQALLASGEVVVEIAGIAA